MQDKPKKIYMYETNYLLLICIFISYVFSILLIALLPEIFWLGLIYLCFNLLISFLMIYENVFTPIYISDNGIKFKSKEYVWDDIKITVYPTRNNLIGHSYFLIISDKYYKNFKNDKLVKKEIMRCPKVYLKLKPLKILLQYYNSKLLVMDFKGINENLPSSTKEINDVINSFNRQIEQ